MEIQAYAIPVVNGLRHKARMYSDVLTKAFVLPALWLPLQESVPIHVRPMASAKGSVYTSEGSSKSVKVTGRQEDSLGPLRWAPCQVARKR
jgi:hypothetical protein